MDRYLPTGNEMISLPKINEFSGAIEDITFLSMQLKGMIELRGKEGEELFRPFIDGVDSSELCWSREHYWIPTSSARAESFDYTVQILTPVAERGFIIHMELCAKEPVSFTWGLAGCWSETWHYINESKAIDGKIHCYQSGWNNSFVMDYRVGTPLFALAPMCDRECESSFRQSSDALRYRISRGETLDKGETGVLNIFWGLGFEEVAAATSAKEMLRRSFEWEYDKTAQWLKKRSHYIKNDKLTKLYNENLFFCIFYSTGRTYDSEELICATSRSPRYYVSAAYWDRDSLLWAFPAILDADKALAREILEYVFTRQRRNIGVHSRYIDGTVLEPGFELDELMAPVIALYSYVSESGDKDILDESYTKAAVKHILSLLKQQKSEKADLYETFLQPTDDERVYPYITYDNALVWRSLTYLAELYPEMAQKLIPEAEAVRAAIFDNCVFENDNGKYFGWSVDLEGRHDIYDEPPGSLQLLPYYGFVEEASEIWKSTVAMIRDRSYAYSFAGKPFAEIGCPHAPHPWVLSLCNSLLAGHAQQAWEELERIKMDNGIACESVDEYSGEEVTGAAFATCAGFLCHSMRVAAKEGL